MSKLQQPHWITAKKRQPDSNKLAPKRNQGKESGRWFGMSWPGLVRWLHLYLSVVSFVLVLFFAVTGFTLNHADWFDSSIVSTDTQGQLKANWVGGADTAVVNKLAVAEYLRATHQLKGSVSEFRIDDRQCTISFRGPGYAADIFVNRADGTYELSVTQMGVVAVLNDLHKGRDTGRSWGWVIDVSAVFMTLVSVTGLLLLLVLKKRRSSGLWWLVIGGLLSLLIWGWLVP